MIIQALAAVFCLPLSMLLIIGFFLQRPQENGRVLSLRNLKFTLLHGLLFAGGLGGVMALAGAEIGLLQQLILLTAVTATDLAIVHALKRPCPADP